MQLMTITEAMEDISASDYKRVALFDKNGEQVVPFNNQSTSLEDRLEEIKKRLDSKVTPPGVYQLKAKHWGNKAVPNIYYVTSSNYETALSDITPDNKAEIIIHEKQSFAPGMLSPDEQNDLFRQKIELEYKVKELERIIEDLEDQISELEEENDNKKSGFGLSENTQTFLEGTIANVVPLLDKVLQQRDANIGLEYAKLQFQQQMAQNNQAIKQMSDQAPNDNQVMHGAHLDQGGEVSEEEESYIVAMENLRRNHPDLYELAMERMREEAGEYE